jgi:hypothetical protein
MASRGGEQQDAVAALLHKLRLLRLTTPVTGTAASVRQSHHLQLVVRSSWSCDSHTRAPPISLSRNARCSVLCALCAVELS